MNIKLSLQDQDLLQQNWTYNEKTKELFGDFANLNEVNRVQA